MRRFALISLGLHSALLSGALWWFHQGAEQGTDTPDKLPTVELVMLEQKGVGPAAPPPAAAAEPAPAEPPDAPPATPTETDPSAEKLPVPSPPPPPPTPSAQASAIKGPEPSPAPAPLQINLGGGQDETSAIARGDQIVPAGLDARYHNKEPVYPPDAARRAEQGTVDLLVHVAPDGVAQGVDVTGSSGYVRLDQAARDAVSTWHFLPALKGGSTIPFDMPFRVVFRLD
jgi:protein TonB